MRFQLIKTTIIDTAMATKPKWLHAGITTAATNAAKTNRIVAAIQLTASAIAVIATGYIRLFIETRIETAFNRITSS